MGRLLQHHPHAAAAKGRVYSDGSWTEKDQGGREYLPLHVALGAGLRSKEIKASCEAIGMILAAHPQVRTAQPQRGAS